MFFLKVYFKTRKKVLVKVIKEAHLINKLIIKLLIRINVIILKGINIIIFKKLIYINNYNINLKLKVY